MSNVSGALHRTRCGLWLIAAALGTLTRLVRTAAATLALFARLLGLPAKIVQTEEEDRHFCTLRERMQSYTIDSLMLYVYSDFHLVFISIFSQTSEAICWYVLNLQQDAQEWFGVHTVIDCELTTDFKPMRTGIWSNMPLQFSKSFIILT